MNELIDESDSLVKTKRTWQVSGGYVWDLERMWFILWVFKQMFVVFSVGITSRLCVTWLCWRQNPVSWCLWTWTRLNPAMLCWMSPIRCVLLRFDVAFQVDGLIQHNAMGGFLGLALYNTFFVLTRRCYTLQPFAYRAFNHFIWCLVGGAAEDKYVRLFHADVIMIAPPDWGV